MPVIGKMLFSGEGGQISPEFYTVLFTMHATVMIFFVIIPILAGAFGNFLIPLMIGAEDMAFPTLNMLSYWFMWPAFIAMGASFFVEGGAAKAGWTSYPPLSLTDLNGQTLWLIGLTFVGVSSMMGSVNYMTTIIQMRAPGMTMFRLPMTIWAMFITAILQAFALPVLTAAGFMQLMDRTLGTGFFIPEGWTANNSAHGLGRRAAAAVAAPVLVLFAPGRVHHDPAGDGHGLRHHRLLRAQAAVRLQADGLLDRRHRGAGLHRVGPPHVHLGHEPGPGHDLHGLDDDDRAAQRHQDLQLAGHRLGRQHPASPRAMLFALSFVSMFIIGGLSGIFMAATPVDIFIHDTYFIVAHFHYVLFAGTAMGVFGAIYFWYPKMFGRMMNERWGKVHFLLHVPVSQRHVLHDAHPGRRRLSRAAWPIRTITRRSTTCSR